MVSTSEAVANRHKLTPNELSQMDQNTQKAVVQATLNDRMLKPAIDQAMKLSQKGTERMRQALKGEEEKT